MSLSRTSMVHLCILLAIALWHPNGVEAFVGGLPFVGPRKDSTGRRLTPGAAAAHGVEGLFSPTRLHRSGTRWAPLCVAAPTAKEEQVAVPVKERRVLVAGATGRVGSLVVKEVRISRGLPGFCECIAGSMRKARRAWLQTNDLHQRGQG